MARQQNISFDQGSDVSIEVTVTDVNGDVVDLSGYTANAALRKHYLSANGFGFETETGDNGLLTLSMNHVVSANIEAGRYVYDVTITGQSSNLVWRVVEGIATVRPGVASHPITTADAESSDIDGGTF